MITATGIKVEIHTLVNRFGHKLIYRVEASGPNWNRVTITSKFKGEWVSEFTVSRDEARAHWQCQLNAGFVNPAAF